MKTLIFEMIFQLLNPLFCFDLKGNWNCGTDIA